MERKGIFSRFLGNTLGIIALTGFAVTILMVLPAYMFIFTFTSPKRAPHIAHMGVSRNWAKLLFPLFFIRYRVHGMEKLDPERTYVFIANHRSMLDIPAYALACKNTFRFLAKKELTRIPGLGWIINRLYISVDRSDHNQRAKSMEAMKQSLRDGISVFICPEGTRNTSDRPLLPFKDGAFRLAIEAQVPMAVLTVIGSDKRLSPLHPLTLLPGNLTCTWDEPIETKGMTLSDIDALKEKAKNLMERHFN